MTNIDEQNLRAGIRGLIRVAAEQTGDSTYYVALIVEKIARDIVNQESYKPPTRLVSTSRYEPPTYERVWNDDPDESRDDE